MNGSISAQDAIDRIRQSPDDYQTPESLRSLAAQVDANASGKVTVLYSGPAAKDIWSTDVIGSMIDSGEDIRVIDKSQASKFLNSREFYTALADIYEISPRELIEGSHRGPATEWLYHPTQGPWADASGRFADATVGEVHAIVGDAQPSRVFGEIEVPRILANPNVTSIEGLPREALVGVKDRLGQQAAFELIVARAREHEGMLRIPASDDALRENKVLRLDNREYFRGTAIEGTSKALDQSTLPLSQRMNPPTEHAQAGQARWDEWQGRNIQTTPEPEIPGLRRAGMTAGLAGLGVAATAYDASQTGERVGTLLAQDNLTAARSEALHFGARGVGGWAGGAAAAAVVGTTGAGPVALVVADGYLFSAAADKAVTLWDNRQIYTQTDKQGVSWEFNASQWLRQEKADLPNDGVDAPQKQAMFALPEKARELNYHASGEATEQALGKVQPSNPYVQPSSEADAAHLYARDWRHDPANGQWSRMVADDVDRNDRPVWTVDPASPERSAALDQQAAQVVDANIARGPAAIAATYQAAHQRNGWEDFGPVPAAVQTALNPDSLQASDGKQYQRDTQGQWRHDGVAAEGNVPLELNATRERLQPALEQHAQALAQMPARQTPTPQQQDQANTEATYAAYGVAPNAQTAGAIQLAVQKTREANGIDAATSSLALERDATGQYSVDSPIQHLSRDADGAVRVAATTSTDEIHQALGEVQSLRQEQPPSANAPERRIDAQSPQERDAYEQALREANRQGVSTQEAQQVASFAATTVTAPHVDETKAPQAAIDVQRDRDVARTPDAPAVAETATPAPVVMPASVNAPLPEDARPVAKPAEPKPEPVPQREPQETRTPEVAAPPTAGAVQPKAEAVAPPLVSTAAPSAGPASSALTSREETPTQATVPTPPSSHEVEGLRLGDRGQEVEFLQYRLQQVDARGPNGQAVPQDGHYGPETEHAVRQFQQDQGLPATGVAGQDLDEALSQAQHARREALKPTAPASANGPVEQGSEQQAQGVAPQNDAPSAVPLQAEQQEAMQASSPAIPTQSEVPAQIVLPEPQPAAYVSSLGFGGETARSNAHEHDEDRVEQVRPFQDVAQQAFPSDHRDYALFSAIQAQLPKGTSDEKTAEVLHAVKESGIERANELRKVIIQDDVAFVFGKTPGFHSETSLNTPSPGINETLQKTEAMDQQRAQEMVQFQREREEIDKNPTGPVMTMAARSQQQAMSDTSSGDGGGG
ncbi:peptidoglycan-binding protein [Xanthomonas hortorum pv. gardneri]|uniref:Peptidoglycan-binding protein n=4 Tax=Xanthomonas hortorum TaxID=56454 RepID=A0A6V7ERM7_9XANT|nr:peptidoglycan-binding protein [Xanthomonas hortorum]MCC8496019.1 peptidoglycan-binding protein [Xanthomonas hortorum pv. gardneri]MCE4343911.1 peptidoglycan-binding protein [Xanthomonas hortorum pv. vitians]MCE4530595.1 peptidoglycan-binding protein [Xanthomonas hortorum pv. vitians]MDT7825299.1 peptidoglycan-binding protein [Xanthomonas hortorum pv. vitians]MDV7250853.1 peptidoglycan-binding protein [Xanthomonas hortorum pv. vitians]